MFPPGLYSQTWKSDCPPKLKFLTLGQVTVAHPTWVVSFQTTCVKCDGCGFCELYSAVG